MAEISTLVLGIAALIISSVALFFTARSYSRNTMNDQVKMAQEIMTSAKGHIAEFNSFRANFPKDPDGNLTYLDKQDDSRDLEKHDSLIARVYGDLDWLCYLMNNGVIKDPKVTEYFDTAILEYYEDNFRILEEDRFKRKYGGRPFPDFQERYEKIKEKWNRKHSSV